jgi:hypothetical protein
MSSEYREVLRHELNEAKAELEQLKNKLLQDAFALPPAQIIQSVESICQRLRLVEAESDYVIELCNCKHQMLQNNTDYIKKLEALIAELQPEKL